MKIQLQDGVSKDGIVISDEQGSFSFSVAVPHRILDLLKAEGGKVYVKGQFRESHIEIIELVNNQNW